MVLSAVILIGSLLITACSVNKPIEQSESDTIPETVPAESTAQNDVAVYIFMAENDEYYGSQKARSAYAGLQAAYREKGYTDEQISELLALEIPDNEYFNSREIYNYHGGGNILFDDETILSWITAKSK